MRRCRGAVTSSPGWCRGGGSPFAPRCWRAGRAGLCRGLHALPARGRLPRSRGHARGAVIEIGSPERGALPVDREAAWRVPMADDARSARTPNVVCVKVWLVARHPWASRCQPNSGNALSSLRVSAAGSSRASRSTRARTAACVGGRPVVARRYVQRRLTRAPCQRRIVSGRTNRLPRRSRGSTSASALNARPGRRACNAAGRADDVAPSARGAARGSQPRSGPPIDDAERAAPRAPEHPVEGESDHQPIVPAATRTTPRRVSGSHKASINLDGVKAQRCHGRSARTSAKIPSTRADLPSG
jgi:hypothetical protein